MKSFMADEVNVDTIGRCETDGGMFQDTPFGMNYGPLSPVKWRYHASRVDQMLAGKDERISPVTVHFVPTLRCDHLCYFCTYGGAKGNCPELRSPNGVGNASQLRIAQKDMPFQLVRSVLDQIALIDVKGVIFTGGGEPTLYRELPEAMAYCRELGIEFALNTNGRGLCHGLVRRIMPLNPRYIRVSLNAGSPEIQRLVTGIDDFELIIENIKLLVRSKAACNATTDISIGYVINVVNLYDILGIVYKMCEIERSMRAEEIEDSIYSIQFRPVGNYESSKNYSKKMVSEIMKHLRVIGGEERAQEFWRFMNEGEQCSARILDQALEVLDGEAAKLIGEWGANIRLVYPRQKFKYLPQVAYKPYDRCRVLPWFLLVWPDGTVYPCIEWAGTPGFEIGNLAKQDIHEILFGGVRQKKIEEINQTDLRSRCAPICAHYEMNIALDHVARQLEKSDVSTIRAKLKEACDQCNAPPHLEFL